MGLRIILVALVAIQLFDVHSITVNDWKTSISMIMEHTLGNTFKTAIKMFKTLGDKGEFETENKTREWAVAMGTQIGSFYSGIKIASESQDQSYD